MFLLNLLTEALRNLGRAIGRRLVRRWWRFRNQCWACGAWPQLPGRHVCQKCSLQALRLDTGVWIASSQKRDSRWH